MSRDNQQPGTSSQSTRPRAPTMADVAARAQVDQAVVSKVLSDDPMLNIREATRQRVLRAVEDLHYQPNANARSLRTARANAFGLVLPDFSNPVYTAIIAGAEAEATQRRSLLWTSSISTFDADQYVNLLAPGRIDGLLLTDITPSPRTASRLQRINVPWLSLNRRNVGCPRYVILDDERAAMLAVQHLIDFGHRRIGHLAGSTGDDSPHRRHLGYLAALAAAGIDHDPTMIVKTDSTTAGGARAMHQLLTQSRPPTAVFVVNLAAAIGALSAARRLGWRIPKDVSVIAIHNLPLAEYLEPPLTTVQLPLAELGRRGIGALATRKNSQEIAEVIAGPIELVLRQSTGPPPSMTRL